MSPACGCVATPIETVKRPRLKAPQRLPVRISGRIPRQEPLMNIE